MKTDLLRNLRARSRSRADLRHFIETMRAVLASPGGHVHIGPAGVAVEYVNSWGGCSRLSGYGLDHVRIALPLLALGVPGLDTRPCEARDDFIRAVLGAPLCAVDGRPDPEPDLGWNGMSNAPLSALVDHWRRHGAAVINFPVGLAGCGKGAARATPMGPSAP